MGQRRAPALVVTIVATIALSTLSACAAFPGALRTWRDPSGARSGADPPGAVPGAWDWPTYGHDAQHTFHGRTTLTASSASKLAQAWFFPTGDAVTATPTVVDGTVYAGSWDGNFYAVDLATGRLRWKFGLDPQPAVSPQPGVTPRDYSSDGGLVTSSAWFEPARRGRPPLIIFGGGYTLYALDAHNGRLVWKHEYTGRPELPPNPDHDETRIFSSPVVSGDRVLFGVSADGDANKRGYIVAASLVTGNPMWIHETDVDASGQVLDDGCGGIWSSGSVLPRAGLVVFDMSDCHFENPPPLSESVFALKISTGALVWQFRPSRVDNQCDWDFGASANVGLDAFGRAEFLGVGGKDGTYYSLDPRTGLVRWSTNVVFGGFSGGFIGTTAYDGRDVYGSTALGDFGRFEGVGMQRCDPSNPLDQPVQDPSVHAFDAATGSVLWQELQAQSFAPTTVAGGLTFNGVGLQSVVQVRDAREGSLVTALPLAAPCWSGIATVGNAIVFGTGASQQGSPDGIAVYTPGGTRPVVPRR